MNTDDKNTHINISALERAGNDARKMQENWDKDLSNMGKVIARLVSRRLQKQKRELVFKKAAIEGSVPEKIYTSAQGSAPKDD